MNTKDYYYFKKAKEVSYSSDFPRCHIGCIAVYKNIILAKGYNTRKTNPLQLTYNKYRDLDWNNGVQPKAMLHAEMMCLLKIKNLDINFSKVKLYIYRENLKGELAICKPCKACQKAINNLGIKDVYYTIDNNYKKGCDCYSKDRYDKTNL